MIDTLIDFLLYGKKAGTNYEIFCVVYTSYDIHNLKLFCLYAGTLKNLIIIPIPLKKGVQ